MSEPKPLLAPLKPAQVTPRLWSNGRFVDTPWRVLADEEALPEGGHVLLPLARWRRDKALLAARPDPSGARLGLLVAPTDTLDAVGDEVQRCAVIALAFPKFSDGRAYSQARRLREAGYKGEIRATGDVLLDQLPLMLRAGFDAFEISSAATLRALDAGPLPAVSHVYQSAAERVTSAWHARRSS